MTLFLINRSLTANKIINSNPVIIVPLVVTLPLYPTVSSNLPKILEIKTSLDNRIKIINKRAICLIGIAENIPKTTGFKSVGLLLPAVVTGSESSDIMN